MSRAELSRRCEVTDAAITNLFSEEEGKIQIQSRIVPQVHEAIGWPAPLPPEAVAEDDPDTLRNELQRAWPSLSDDEREIFARILRLRRPT